MGTTTVDTVTISVVIKCLYPYRILRNYVLSLRIGAFLLVPTLMCIVHPLRILNHPLGVVHQFPQLVRQDLFLQVVLLPALLLLVHHQVDDEQRAVINFTNF